MNNSKILFLFLISFVLLLLATPKVFANEYTGQAIMKKMTVKKDGKELSVEDPVLLFEGQHYFPLRFIADTLQKKIYMDEKSKNIVIENEPLTTTTSLFQDTSIFIQQPPSVKLHEQVTSEGVILLEDDEAHIMFEKNGFSTFYPASTTKVLTALIALERGNMDDIVTVSENINLLPSDSSKAFIHPGDQLTLEQLLYGMMLVSGNDAAFAIAEHIAGSEKKFAALMNEKAKELGAVHSHFVNAHGYHHPDHYTTPYDLALILKAASEHPLFLKIINTRSYRAVFQNKQGETVIRNWNNIVAYMKNPDLYVKGMIGGKTGYTNAAKRSLVTVAEQNGHRYYFVALKGNALGRYIDAKNLLLSAYEKRKTVQQEIIKNIRVHFFNHAIQMANQYIFSPDQIFIYNGRTYVSNMLLNEILATVQFQSTKADRIEVHIGSKFLYERKLLSKQVISKEQPIMLAINKTIPVQKSTRIHVQGSNKYINRMLLSMAPFFYPNLIKS